MDLRFQKPEMILIAGTAQLRRIDSQFMKGLRAFHMTALRPVRKAQIVP